MPPMRLAALLLALLTGAPLFGADFQAGVEAYRSGNFERALAEWTPLAENGHADAQNNLGVMYQTGRGVAPDPAQAARWYQQAAEQNHVDAQNNLAALYMSGNGVERDQVQAYIWLERAARQGDAQAGESRDQLRERMSEEDLARARQALDTRQAAPAPTPPAPPPVQPQAPQQAPVVTRSAPAAPPPSPPPVNVQPGQNSYGPVPPGMTLWSIAKALIPDNSITTQQMIVALLRSNPEAFPSGINSLQSGAMLRVPPLDQVRGINPAEARREVDRRLGR